MLVALEATSRCWETVYQQLCPAHANGFYKRTLVPWRQLGLSVWWRPRLSQHEHYTTLPGTVLNSPCRPGVRLLLMVTHDLNNTKEEGFILLVVLKDSVHHCEENVVEQSRRVAARKQRDQAWAGGWLGVGCLLPGPVT